MTYIVTGLFDDPTQACSVVEDLENSQFDRGDISLVASSAGETTAMSGDGQGAGMSITGNCGDRLSSVNTVTTAGIGPSIVAGPFAGMLSSSGDGASSGGLIDALTQSGVPEQDAQFYAEGVRRGSILVAVSHCPEDAAQQAADIMHRHGAIDISNRGAWYQKAGFAGFNTQAQPYTSDQITQERQQLRDQGQIAIPVVEEELAVGKRSVERGGARVYSHITEQPVEEQVRLREEHVSVDRRPVDRAASAADMAAFQEGSIEIPEMREEAVVAKQARVVEEVVVSKDASERTETVRDTVRRTDVEVQPIGAGQTAATAAGRDLTGELEEDEDVSTQREGEIHRAS